MSSAAWRWIWQRPSSLSDLGRVPRISGAGCSRSPSAQAMTEAASWRLPTSQSFSSSGGQASLYPLAPAGWWQRQAAWKGRIDATQHEPARFGQARQFGTGIQRQRQATKRHLYLVLDDHEKEFSIHKLDIDNDDLDVGCGSLETPLHFSEPPVLRVGPPTIGRGAQFAALGSHIIAICSKHGTLSFDTKTATHSVSAILPVDLRRLYHGYEVAIAARNRLYVFESCTDKYDGDCLQGGLHCLAENPSDDDSDWTWKPLSDSSQFSWSWTNCPPEFPFYSKNISAHVIHPRTGTILVSTLGRQDRGTYSYGTGGSGKWKCRGDWVLPFEGHAPYDDVLGAWVELHLPSDDNHSDGYLCACHVMPGWQLPKWKVGMEKLFLNHPHWRHVDAKLIHMGERSKYCLVERLLPEGMDKMKYVLRLTTFIVKYGKNGKIRTMAHQPPRFYKAPSYHPYSHLYFDEQPLQAFWM